MSLHVVVVTGLSGAGRSTALHVLEDLGFYCVDNLPPALALPLAELASARSNAGEPRVRRLGLGVDVRTGTFLAGSAEMLDALREAAHGVDVLFLDCADDVLLRRYSETRRPHPLASGGNVLGAIESERERLSALRAEASHVIDTSDMSVHDLKRAIVSWMSRDGASWQMVVRVVSFGFKYGLPKDADLVFDLRHLPNPHHDPALRPHTGLEAIVADFVLGQPAALELLDDVTRLLLHTLPRYAEEGKAYLTIAVGCTGGRHRSVALAEALSKRLGDGREVHVHHRDVGRGGP